MSCHDIFSFLTYSMWASSSSPFERIWRTQFLLLFAGNLRFDLSLKSLDVYLEPRISPCDCFYRSRLPSFWYDPIINQYSNWSCQFLSYNLILISKEYLCFLRRHSLWGLENLSHFKLLYLMFLMDRSWSQLSEHDVFSKIFIFFSYFCR